MPKLYSSIVPIKIFVYISDYRHSIADKAPSKHHQMQDNPSTADLNRLKPTLDRYHTAQIRGRHNVINYENGTGVTQPKFWTLPKITPSDNIERSIVKEDRTLVSPKSRSLADTQATDQIFRQTHEDSIRISPIDPRTSATFKSSTPTNKENVIDLSSRLLSPVKSNMTNEELYAVIHKSKKKLNIKETSDRAESPALTAVNLSPVSSEATLAVKSSQRYPETGYLGDAKNRTNFSNVDRMNSVLNTVGTFGIPKQETCADRYGPLQQTSRLDFKKLLLQHSVKLNTHSVQTKSNKLSAVEQLKLSKEKAQVPMTPPDNRSQINILDLSGSPKTYTQRKTIKTNNQPLSPGRTSTLMKEHKNTSKILLSPKSQWRFASPRSDVLSTPIPEANNEDENSNSSGEKCDKSPASPPSKTVPIMTNQHFGARRTLIPINEYKTNEDRSSNIDQGVFPIGNTDYPNTQVLSRSEIIQAKRAEFFKSTPEPSAPKFTSFKSPNSPNTESGLRNKISPERGKTSPTTLETAL